MLRLHLLGAPDLRRRGEGPILSVLTGSKRLALLAYLALEAAGGFVRRDALLALLWPESDSQRARGALRNLLYQLRQALGGRVVTGRGQEEVGVSEEALWCDVWAFEEALSREAWKEALDLYRGELLPGYHLSGASSAFERWLSGRRRELHRRAVDAAWRRARKAETEGNAEVALRSARRAVELAPMDAESQRRLVELLVRLERPAAAVKAFQSFARAFRQELGMEPPRDLRELAAELRASQASEEDTPQAGGPPPAVQRSSSRGGGVGREEGAPRSPDHSSARRIGPRLGLASVLALVVLGVAVWYGTRSVDADGSAATPSRPDAESVNPVLAVLPFENLSSDSTNTYFAAGLHEDLLTRLAKLSGLRVVSRTSVQKYAGTEQSPREIGRELAATALVEGSVRRAGERFRVTVQLVDAKTGVHIWADDYDRVLSVPAVLDVQTTLAEQIAGALRAELTASERVRIGHQPTRDLKAYEDYLRGREHFYSFYATQRPVHGDSCIFFFRRAVHQDPAFAEAHAGLALGHLIRLALSTKGRWLDSAFAAARRAEELAPDRAETHVAVGMAHYFADSLELARRQLNRALELQPSNTLAMGGLAVVVGAMHRYPEAVRWWRRLVRLEPGRLAHVTALTHQLINLGYLEAAEAWAAHVEEKDPGAYRSVLIRANVAEVRGETERALDMTRDYLEDHPDNPAALRQAIFFALEAHRAREAIELSVRYQRARKGVFARDSPSRPDEFTPEALLGYARVVARQGSRGRRLLESFEASIVERSGGTQTVSPSALFQRASVRSALGDRDEALRYLEHAYELGYRDCFWIAVSPFLQNVRDTPRFETLVGEMRADVERMRRQVREMGIELYPNATDTDSVSPAVCAAEIA